MNSYPEYVQVDGQQFKLDTDFRTGLKCFEVINDPDISDYERSLAVIYLLLDDLPENVNFEKLMDVLKVYLSCGRKDDNSGSGGKKDMDLNEDENYIVSSFMHDYGIDLTRPLQMHWWRFIALLDGLSSECILSRIRDIRTCDLNDYKGKARTRMAKAKEAVALKKEVRYTDEEKDAIDHFESLLAEKPKGSNCLDDGDTFLDEDEDN